MNVYLFNLARLRWDIIEGFFPANCWALEEGPRKISEIPLSRACHNYLKYWRLSLSINSFLKSQAIPLFWQSWDPAPCWIPCFSKCGLGNSEPPPTCMYLLETQHLWPGPFLGNQNRQWNLVSNAVSTSEMSRGRRVLEDNHELLYLWLQNLWQSLDLSFPSGKAGC